MSESGLPVHANSMGSGENISTYDPFLKKTPLKRLRDIIGKKKEDN